MGQSLVNNYLHIIFSTKNREPMIYEGVENELYAYLGGICKNLECYPLKIGGHKDHVHILCMLSKKIALMTFMEEIKSNSSKWIKLKDSIEMPLSKFYWQNGYGAFSVDPAKTDVVISYINNQKEHHAKWTFQDEYRLFLKKNKVEYDERYVWD